jgi:Sulfotransferase family
MAALKHKVFIVGCPRSGTSWVRSILSQHESVVGQRPESHFFPVLYGPLTAPGPRRRAQVLRAFDDRVERREAVGGPHRWVDRPTLERLLAETEADGLAGEAAARYVIDGIVKDFFARNAGDMGRVVVEKTPGHLMYADRILEWWPDALIIEVVRDGRDVCASLSHKSDVTSWAPSDRRAQIEFWVNAIRHGIELRSTPAAQGRWHRVRYEDLSDTPIREIRRMYQFTDLSADDDFISRVLETAAFDRSKRMGDRQHVRKGQVGAWRNEFTDTDRREFESLAGDLLVTLGYED